MSTSPIADVWDSGPQTDRCKTPTLLDHLDRLDLLGAGVDRDLLDRDPDEAVRELTERDEDRLRLVKFLVSHPSGVALKTLVSLCLKGQRPGSCERFDGSDADYQFARRFVKDLASREPELAEMRKEQGACYVVPTFRMLDLISEGITQTQTEDDGNLYDREFARELLKRSVSLDDEGKELLADSLQRYIDRIDQYRLLFDVHFSGRTGDRSTKRMTKTYKTRFNDRGRISKTFARFNAALEDQFEKAENAVLCTLTTDPGTFADSTRPDPRPLLEQISTINENFNRLLSYFDSDPSTKDDTRKEHVPAWRPGLDGDVTGRPRDRPEYIKALEFTEDGKPHLHVLFFDVPERESDGMPWLIDKHELEKKWKDYGQGQIVDLYPLTYRDDLDEIGNFGEDTTEGFVDWYRFGDHDHGEQWVEDRARSHELIDFYNLEEDEEQEVYQKTAGAYLGKYLSATFGALLDQSESLDDSDEHYEDKAATWKIAMYWATNRRFWSLSRGIERSIEKHDHIQDPEVRRTVRWATVDTLERESRGPVREHLARRQWSDLDALDDAAEWLSTQVVQPGIEAELPESADFFCHVDYLGAYAYWDLPTTDVDAPDLEHFEDHVSDPDADLPAEVGGDRPPPAVDVWAA